MKGKKILLGVSGSIAAYKAAFVIRNFVKAGAEVRVIMTPSAAEFISPLTLATLSKNEVQSTYIAHKEKGTWNNHVELGLWADVLLIAPATANTLAKMNTGITDNLLMAVYLSARCAVVICPAMDLDMYQHASTQKNMNDLIERGHLFIDSEFGELASGLEGKGRMAEPEHIHHFFELYFSKNKPLHNQEWLITAGPTFEPIDPVRFIGNHSSGKMGVALAHVAAELGATVHLISGPGTPSVSHTHISQYYVQSAQDMFDATIPHFKNCSVAILAAAVADYTPTTFTDKKIKKKAGDFQIDLKPTLDILKHLGSIKANQKLIGFALETNNEVENAKKKITEKNLDLVVLNSLQDAGAGFGHDTNKITLIDAQNNLTHFELKSKSEVAIDIINAIQKL
ncbi:MAG: phosphopantothenoylcysteine decarboxylase/phosphopantothenate--cysteine ligase [Salibacteraceae bacterium]|jgi:phosphopantothenoylcysteine decarboxylase/phosphopantothenate--cysteine ligase